MALGFDGIQLNQLKPYQLFVLGERVMGYCVYPHDELQRDRYQLKLSFYRSRLLEASARDPDWPEDLEVGLHDRDGYLAEEAIYFEQLGDAGTPRGGMDAFMDAEGHDFYLVRILDLLRISSDVASIATWLVQIHNTPGEKASLAKAKKLLKSAKSDTTSLAAANAGSSIKGLQGNRYHPDLGPQVPAGGPGTNLIYIDDVWKDYAPVVPLLAATGLLSKIGRLDGKPSLNPFSRNAIGFIGLSVLFESFLPTTHYQGKARFLDPLTPFWRFPDNLLRGVPELTLDQVPGLGPLAMSALKLKKGNSSNR